ncbi:hypothetical protein DFP72DRAFT_257550 [Ephemerocybe angulata]|uniref:Uncharacterized protein n=1 Tax=Ephemerocybe angulata TaxID=980116 RepID=A0A8H6H8Z9_9AGAR|nr:hypothetical protein DFP72DRAFT_257550 [Tulosesus angulatus]
MLSGLTHTRYGTYNYYLRTHGRKGEEDGEGGAVGNERDFDGDAACRVVRGKGLSTRGTRMMGGMCIANPRCRTGRGSRSAAGEDRRTPPSPSSFSTTLNSSSPSSTPSSHVGPASIASMRRSPPWQAQLALSQPRVLLRRILAALEDACRPRGAAIWLRRQLRGQVRGGVPGYGRTAPYVAMWVVFMSFDLGMSQ